MRKSSPRTALSPFKRYWWVAIPAFLASIGGALVYLAITPKLYQAAGRLSVEDERTSVSDIGQTLTEADELGGANPIVTQAEVVKSQGVLQDALEIVAGGPAETEIPSVGKLMRDLQVNIIPATNLLEIAYRAEDPRQSALIVNAVAQAAVAQSVEDINLEAKTVRNFLASQVPSLEAKLREAELAESQYRQNNGLLAVDAQNQQMVGGLAALEQEERALLSSLAELSSREQQLSNVVGINSPEAAYDIARVGQDPQLATLRSQITATSVAVAEARSKLGDQHPELLALGDELANLQTLYQQRLAELTPSGQGSDFGNAATALASNDLSQQLISDAISNSIEARALNNRLEFVQTELERMRQTFAQQPSLQQPLAVLSRQRQEAADSLELIQSKLEEARIAEAQLVTNVRIVGLAEAPEEPISPSPIGILALGAIAGSILTIGTILLLDLLDASLQSGEEVEKLVKLPVLGYLPRLSADLLNIEGLDAFLDTPRQVEPYRALLKTIESRQRMRTARAPAAADTSSPAGDAIAEPNPPQTSAADVRPQVIVVSSPIDNEGKSSVATCLGAVSAMLGRRTLVIEADAQNPVQHTYLQIEQQPGLTDLVRQTCSLADAVKLTTIGRLSVLPYGQPLNRPSTVTESRAMRVLIEALARDYDLILIDTAPVNSSADAATVSQMTDGLLLVTRPGYTPRSVLSDSVQQLRKSGAPLLGIAMNETISPEEQMGILPRSPARQPVATSLSNR